MSRFTVEETNLLSIYHTGNKQKLLENIHAALPFMDEDMNALAMCTIEKIDALSEMKYAALSFFPADEI